MTSPSDIASRDDVATLVEDFYNRCFADDLLGPVFVDVARLDLRAHLPRMVDFWMTVLFRAGLYDGNVLDVHVALHDRHPLTAELLDRWLETWTATVSDTFAGEVADRAVLQARRFAWSMSRRLMGESGSALQTVSREELVIALPGPSGP